MGEVAPAVVPAVEHDHPPKHPLGAQATAGDKPRIIDPVDKYSALIVRGTIVGCGLVGVALFLRNSRLFARFEHVSQIPKDFIRKELELKGRVREILPSGELRVEHEPVIKIPSIIPRRKPNPGSLLNIRLAGVDLSKAGQQFLAKDIRINNKPVTFTVIKPTDGSPDAVDADVTVKKNAFARTNLNLEVVRRGYARVPAPDHPRHLNALQTVPAYSRLISRLLMSEKVADRRGVGVWERDTWVESLQSYPSQVGQMVRAAPITKFIVLVFNISKDVVLFAVKLVQQSYAIMLAACGYIVGGYRKFAKGVDSATAKYNSIRQRIKQ